MPENNHSVHGLLFAACSADLPHHAVKRVVVFTAKLELKPWDLRFKAATILGRPDQMCISHSSANTFFKGGTGVTLLMGKTYESDQSQDTAEPEPLPFNRNAALCIAI